LRMEGREGRSSGERGEGRAEERGGLTRTLAEWSE
jgi:hypothetical protein